ncbi:MAG: EscU/YscU/HrcU family type III secretion system export apparatus switch protein, partial [Acidobacteriia bacterium]|nr:EscU/YscU/HrcU family type III secretion system export apparatus switch protein [Terriglobia bacterium]
MADSGQRTEKPTQRRIEKARKEGNFPASREFVSSVQFIGFVAIAGTFGGTFIIRTARVVRYLFSIAFTTEITVPSVVSLMRGVVAPALEPLVYAGAALVLLVLFAQLASTKGGISVSKLTPDFKRLDPMKKLTSLGGQNVPMLLQALILLPAVGAAVYYEVKENLDSFLELPWMPAQAGMVRVGSTISTLMWRSAGFFLVVGLVDLIWQRQRYMKQLKMSKQEIREESKEQEGNPQIKGRVRRLQRDLLRRQMMKEVPKATAVIVNPTHFAVAIRYSVDSPGAPRVVAKGKNYLALRIRKMAIEHQVPIVENPPLAQALY